MPAISVDGRTLYSRREKDEILAVDPNRRCRHCGKWRCKPRGLCYACYITPEIQERYVSAHKSARRGIRDFCGGSLPLPVPTTALPGSEEKIAVLEDRAMRGKALWHEADGMIME